MRVGLDRFLVRVRAWRKEKRMRSEYGFNGEVQARRSGSNPCESVERGSLKDRLVF